MTAIFRRVSKSGVAIGSAIGAALLAGTLSGCVKSKGELVVDDSVGVTALRDPCPRVAIPEYAGDVTLFSIPSGPIGCARRDRLDHQPAQHLRSGAGWGQALHHRHV
jgi:hypothetical protein